MSFTLLNRRVVLLDHVLIHPESLVEASPSCHNPARVALECRFSETFVVDTGQLKNNPDLVSLGQEHLVIDEPADRQQGVKSTGILVRLDELAKVYHNALLLICRFAGS